MNRSKFIKILALIIICGGIITLIGSFIFKEESSLNKTFEEVYQGLTDEEKQQVKDNYKEMQDAKTIKDKLNVKLDLPEDMQEKFYPKEFTEPIQDFLNSKEEK